MRKNNLVFYSQFNIDGEPTTTIKFRTKSSSLILRNMNISFLVVFCVYYLAFLTEGLNCSKDNSWDELTFTQIWGYSDCLQFKEETGGREPCRYEDKRSIWTIHGIWPTKIGTLGPSFCEKVHFDPTLIEPIRNELEHYWYEINEKKDPDEFWTHEWTKHGSCAMESPDFENEFKYFNSGLNFRKKYDLYSALKDSSIIPRRVGENGYTLEQIQNAFRHSFRVTPYIQCLHTKEGDVHLLAVEICMDRKLSLIDCSKHVSHQLGLNSALPCPPNQPILYQDNIPVPRVAQKEL